MAKYVEANWLLERAVPHSWSTPLWVSINDAPAEKVIEIVRCKDCIYSQDIRACNLPYGIDGYCPLGKGFDNE